MKLFRQRWYVVAHLQGRDRVLVFSLDRIRELKPLEGQWFVFPESFSPEEFFANCYGVFAGTDVKVERVVLRATASQANYLRDLPLHVSQEETERTKDYSLFTLYVRPTFDFEQELLWNAAFVEVLQPAWLREELGGLIAHMGELYV